jgi:hypothetical protein
MPSSDFAMGKKAFVVPSRNAAASRTEKAGSKLPHYKNSAELLTLRQVDPNPIVPDNRNRQNQGVDAIENAAVSW